jgi:hypothetical protein
MSKDFFAAMQAGVDRKMRPDMEAIPPLKLAERRLPDASCPGLVPPPPHEKLDTADKLAERLRALHRQYDPFLRNLTPDETRPRPRLPLRRFDFRFEQADDRSQPVPRAAKSGAWEAVEIPHYRGPMGPWAAYYRTTFALDRTFQASDCIWLRFEAVDYACQVYLNGRYIGSHEGLFAPFEFDVTGVARLQAENELVVRVLNDANQGGLWGFRPRGHGIPKEEYYQLHGDKVYAATGQGWDAPDGWTHCPPGGGIWQGVCIEGRPLTSIRDLFVRPLPEAGAAELWMDTYRSDFSRVPTGVELMLYPNNFEGAAVDLGRHELGMAGPKLSHYRIPFSLDTFRWWTPCEPYLYTLRVRLLCREADGRTTEDVGDSLFGMRSFRQDLEGERKGTFLLNGEPVVLRGTNEMGNLSVPVQQGHPERAIEDLLIGKAAHMNFWRITQRPVQPEVYALCDRLGVMFQTDLPLFGVLRHSCIEETARQAGEMERLIRGHAGAVLSSFINEPTPEPATRDKRHRAVDRETLEDFFEICIRYTHLYNPDRVIKCVDGDYFPPPRHGMLDQHAYVCMHEDHGVEVGKLHKGELFAVKQGWRCGVGEYGAEGLEPLATMRRHYPADWLPERDEDTGWTPDRIPFCQSWGWQHQWYERPDTLVDWIAASHRHQAWAVRFMHEGFRRRADIVNSTALHLLVNAWPNNWLKALLSVEREPLPGYFAYADANQPLAVNLRTDRHAVAGGEELDVELWLLNDTVERPEALRVVYRVEMEGQTLLINEVPVQAVPVAAEFQGRLCWTTPVVERPTRLSIQATLMRGDNAVLHDYTLELELWPRPDHSLLANRRIAIVGAEGGDAWRLASAFGAQPVAWTDGAGEPVDLVIADTADAVQDTELGLLEYLEQGGSMLGLPQPAGSLWQIGDCHVAVRDDHPSHQFVSRKTGHPVVSELDPFHFTLWYHPELDRIAHLVDAGLRGDNLRPITLTGTGLWYGERLDIPAGIEVAVGKGRAVFDQVRALERLDAEPRAAAYLARLLEYLL